MRQVGFLHLSPPDQEYLKKRFALEKTHEDLLSAENESNRFNHMMSIVSRLKVLERKGSFSNTPLDLARNATFENPAASNRVDCYLENSLGPLEETLSKDCRTSTKSPKEALKELFFEHRELLVKLKERLPVGESNLLTLQNSWKQLVDCQIKLVETFKTCDIWPKTSDEETPAVFTEILLKRLAENADVQTSFEAYMKSMKKYREISSARSSHACEGVPKLKTLQNQLDKLQSPYVSNILSKRYEKEGIGKALLHFAANQIHLNIPSLEDAEVLEKSFKEGIDEISKRTAETEAQLLFLKRDFEEVHQLMNMFWGHTNEKGSFCTPTKETILKHLNEQLVPVTPTHSRKRKSVIFSSPTRLLLRLKTQNV